MSLLLAIESSSSRGSLALLEGGECLRESHFPEGLLHGREITVRLDEMLRLEGLEPRALGAIAVSSGPGSYTGIRVGVTTAKTLGYALGIPVLAESSLAVLAAGSISAGSGSANPGNGGIRMPVLDGRQGFLFWGLFAASGGSGQPLDDSLRRLLPDRASDLGEIQSALSGHAGSKGEGPFLAFGEAADFFLERAKPGFIARGPKSWDTPSARVLGELAARRAGELRFDLEAIHLLEPSYLRVTEAERKLAEKSLP